MELFGGAGHSLEIVKRLSKKGILIGIDRDDEAIEAASKKLEQYNDHCIVASDSTSVRVYHKDNPLLNNPVSNVAPRAISNISQSQLADDMLNIDDLSISKKLMREENFIFTTTESLACAYFPETEWVHIKDDANVFLPVKFTLFFNLPITAEWREARIKIAERIRKNFNLT